MENIFDRQAAIENEFDEPLRDVVAGFIPQGLTAPEVAEVLEVNPRSLRTFCENSSLRFPADQPARSERIRRGRRNGARTRQLELNGKRQCLTAWAEEAGLNRSTVAMRLKRGKSLAEALA
jgi:hypothetical protein